MVNTRRTTLGGISTNRRVSLAANVDSTTRTRKKRMSMAPRVSGGIDHNINNRRSSLTPGRRKSVGGEHRPSMSMSSSIPPPTTMRTDHRPISEKPYFNACVRRLHQFLETHEYEHSIKLKDLARPSAKDFHSFMSFLLKKVDPSFNASPKRKFEDDVVVAFKAIGYPFNISKTALVAAGSPHTWPTLLLSISWLIEVLEGGSGFDFLQHEYECGIESAGQAGQPLETPEKLEERTEKAYQRYIEISYGSFLSGNDEDLEKLEMELLEYHEKDNMVIEQAIERVMEENVEAEREVNEFSKEGNE